MDSSEETQYVSFLGNEDEVDSSVHRRSPASLSGAFPGLTSNTRVVTTRTYFWKKLLRSPDFKRKAFYGLAAVAVSLLFLGAFFLRLPGFDGGVSPVAPDTNDDTPANIWEWQESHFRQAFSNFQAKYGKKYASEEEHEKRLNIFKSNLIFIHTQNAEGLSYTLGMNETGDLTPEEFQDKYLGHKSSKTGMDKLNLGVATHLEQVSKESLPAAIDWRKKGCVNEIKDQKLCGSCWAFSAVQAVEGASCVKSGKLPNLSEQQLMDCSFAEGNMSCSGGLPVAAFEYIVNNHGICTEKAYPYLAKDNDHCGEKACKSAVKLEGFQRIPQNENAVQAAIARYGPISVAINASGNSFRFYQSGVYRAPCSHLLNHAVGLVGYSTSDYTEDDYFILRNSWGEVWGEDGYMRMVMHQGPEGQCGVLLEASYPVVQ